MPFSATRDLWLVLKARDEASRAMQGFSRDIRMVGDNVRMANLQATRSQLQNQLSVQRLTGATQQQMLATQNRIAQVDREIGQMRVSRAAMEEQRVSAQKLSSALQGAAGVATAFGTGMIAAGVFGAMGLHNLVNAAIEYQKQSALTATQVDKFATSISDIEKIGIRVANAIGVPFEQIQPALFDIFSSMEVGAADAEKLLVVFSKAAVAGQTDIQNASKATIGILNAFHLPLTDVNHLMDVQFQLVKEGVGTYDEWSQRIGLVTPSAVRAGQSVEMMAAALAASTRMGISAARSATAVSRAMDALSNPAAVAALKKLGVNATDANGNFRPMINTLMDFRDVIKNLPEEEKVKKILDVFKGAGGTVEARRFLQNMLITPGNLELFQQIFNTMSTETGSFEQAFSTMANTTATKSQLIANKWQILKVAAGEGLMPVFDKFLDKIGKIFDWFNRMSPATQKTIMTVLAFAAAGSIVVGMLLLLLGTFAAFTSAVVVAGSALWVVLGVFSALGIAVTVTVAAFVIAYKQSQKFRDILASIADTGMHLWHDVIVPFAQDVKSQFDTNLLPPLKRFQQLLEHYVLPIVQKLQDKFGGEFLARAKEVANFVKDRLAEAFKFVGWVIDHWVIPAFIVISKYYADHKETIDMVISALMQAAKWFAIVAVIIGGVLAVALGGPIVGIILVFVAAIMVIINAIIITIKVIRNVVDWFKHFGESSQATGNWFSKIWGKVSDFFVGIWNSILDFLKGIWNDIVGVFKASMAWIEAVWNEFWNSKIVGLVRAIFGLLIAILQGGWAILEFAFLWGIKVLEDIWNAGWGRIVSFVSNIWNTIFPFIKGIWDNIVLIFNVSIAIVIALWNAVWTWVKNFVVGIWNDILAILSDVWNKISGGAAIAWGAVSKIVGDVMHDVWEKVSNGWNIVKNFFADAGKWLFEAGRNIISGLIDGITSKIKDLTDKIKDATQIIKDHFPHSPAKRGPLSGKGGMYYAGQNMVTQLRDGIGSKVGLLNSGSSLIAATTGANMNDWNSGTGTKTINQNITVNTQELNPRRQSAELGWLLAGSM